jgi:hypothetical protein
VGPAYRGFIVFPDRIRLCVVAKMAMDGESRSALKHEADVNARLLAARRHAQSSRPLETIWTAAFMCW